MLSGRVKEPSCEQTTPGHLKSASGADAATTLSLVCLPPQTPTLLLTPSPLLSNIHFWSTLSPVAPLSPATRRQGAYLFQVRTLKSSFRVSAFVQRVLTQAHCSVPVPVGPHPSVPDPDVQHGWDQHARPHHPGPSEDIGVTQAARHRRPSPAAARHGQIRGGSLPFLSALVL